jgi:integrase
MKTKPRKLTDNVIATLKADTRDSEVPGLWVRVLDGSKTFVLVARYGGKDSNPTRRALGRWLPGDAQERADAKATYEKLPPKERPPTLDAFLLERYGATSIATAREKARRWQELLRQGRDPSVVEAAQRAAMAKEQDNSFAAVAEQWFKDKVKKERRGYEVERDVRKYFVEPWAKRPIADITAADVRAVIRTKKNAPVMGRSLLTSIKRLFAWATDEEIISASPAAHLKATKILGEEAEGERRDRALTDSETRAFWRAAERLGGPHGAAYKVLLLTGLRLNEVVDASWSEFDLAKRLWIIRAERMKGRNLGRNQARAHAVPLSDDVLSILEKLPRFTKGKYLFTASHGESSVWISTDVKRKMDAFMLEELRRDEPDATLEPWRNHDLRRTARSCWSRFRIGDEETREALLAHVKPGIKGTYDVYDRLDEKREALNTWATVLRTIVEPPAGDNVVQLRATP